MTALTSVSRSVARQVLARTTASRALSSDTKFHYSIGLIPGDGIGVEVIPEGVRVCEKLAAKHNFEVSFKDYPFSCTYYKQHGVMIPEEGFADLKKHDSLLLGAVGDPRMVPDNISLRGLLVPIRQRFDQYVNLRPSRPLAGIPGTLRGEPNFDMMVVRENSEGEYAGSGGRLKVGSPDEVAIQTTIFTRKGVERIVRYAFELAMSRRQKLASASKSNAMQHAYVMWEDVVDEVAKDYPDVQVTKFHADALAALMVTHPAQLDVVVASNLFGDLLTDLAGALQGSLGIPASANLNPTKEYPSLFEPVHGSAPPLIGRGICNPIATYWAVSLMLDHLGQPQAAADLMEAMERVTKEGKVLTPDLGGSARTAEVTDAVLSNL